MQLARQLNTHLTWPDGNHAITTPWLEEMALRHGMALAASGSRKIHYFTAPWPGQAYTTLTVHAQRVVLYDSLMYSMW